MSPPHDEQRTELCGVCITLDGGGREPEAKEEGVPQKEEEGATGTLEKDLKEGC